MPMKKIIALFAFTLFVFNSNAQKQNSKDKWGIDSIAIHKNWRTKDKIILAELDLKPGEFADKQKLDNSISQVWNIGSFAEVSYSLDSISPNGHLLNITAKDAFNLVPYVTVSGNKDDKKLSMGFSDDNFLGRNIDLNISGTLSTYNNNYKVGIGIPRQLLYKNMHLSFAVSSGTGNNFQYENNKQTAVVAYRKKQLSGSIGNPWHTDRSYTFSPNLSWNLFQHETDTSLIETSVPFADDYKVSYLSLSLSESLGLINRIRHQRNGYSVSGGYGIGIGLNKNSRLYHNFGFGASYYKTFNKVIELSGSFSSGYTTSTLPSLKHYLNSADVKGIINGQESGQAHYTAKLKGSFTYLYFNWFALEHSGYTHIGMADNKFFRMYQLKPRISFGTEFKFWTPMIPWLKASVHFTFLKGNNNWFHLDI